MSDMNSIGAVERLPRIIPLAKTYYIIVVGTPFNGMIPYGPFESKEAAVAWGDQNYPVDEWHIVPLEKAADPVGWTDGDQG